MKTSHTEVTMKLRAKFGVIMLALTFVLASAYIADAGDGTDQQTVKHTYKEVSGDDRDVNSSGAMRVDKDLYPFHYGDTNQFGDDEAYNSISGGSKVPYPIHREDP
jgi:hypothetical protein